ncbi:MAG: radical SAM protein [Candidatus Bathyarchaeia archaeon]
MSEESPDWVRVSLAAAMTLGFEGGLFYRDARLTCINVLMQYQEGCRANCLYCGQAREVLGGSDCKNLIRVEWPSHRLDEVIERTRGVQDRVERVCVAMITHPRAGEDLLTIVERIREDVDLPISTLITPTLMTKEHMRRIRRAGADMIGIAVDAATPELFHGLRGRGAKGPHQWNRYVQGLREAVKVMGPGKVGCHLIAGLGETEWEMVSMIQMVYDLGARTHLFSFFPEAGSAMETWPQPSLEQYRRVQLARYLIDRGISRFERMSFDEGGRLIDLGVDPEALRRVIEAGAPFETSGCPGCNRPFANERPGRPIRNFPFGPTRGDTQRIKEQLRSALPTFGGE